MTEEGVICGALEQVRAAVIAQRGYSDEEFFSLVEKFIDHNSAEWRKEIPTIAYQDPVCRSAYVYMNTLVHAHVGRMALACGGLTIDAIRRATAAGRPFRICAFGGGPGSELLALAALLSEHESVTVDAEFLLVDQVKQWDETWQILKDGLEINYRQRFGPNRRTWPVLVSRSFLPMDTLDVSDFERYPNRFANLDLFIFSYLISEIMERWDDFKEVLSHLIQRSNPSSLIVVVDRNERLLRDSVAAVADEVGGIELVRLEQARGQIEPELSELGDWYRQIRRLPRRAYQTFFAVLRRREPQ